MCPGFERLEGIFGDLPNLNPPSVRSSLPPAVTSADNQPSTSTATATSAAPVDGEVHIRSEQSAMPFFDAFSTQPTNDVVDLETENSASHSSSSATGRPSGLRNASRPSGVRKNKGKQPAPEESTADFLEKLIEGRAQSAEQEAAAQAAEQDKLRQIVHELQQSQTEMLERMELRRLEREKERNERMLAFFGELMKKKDHE